MREYHNTLLLLLTLFFLLSLLTPSVSANDSLRLPHVLGEEREGVEEAREEMEMIEPEYYEESMIQMDENEEVSEGREEKSELLCIV